MELNTEIRKMMPPVGGVLHAPRLAAGLVLLMALWGSVAGAQGSGPRLVDRIVAIVDEEAILQSDLDREIELFKMEKEYAGEPIPADSPEVRREMLDRLIESKLIIAAAKQADMDVDEEAIEQSVQEKIDQFVEHFGSLDNLRRELNRSGMTLDDYRARMKSQLRDQQYLRLVVGKFIRPNIEVLENEVRDYYLANLEEMPAEPDSLTIANILVPVQPSVEVRQQIQDKVSEIQAALASGRPFADVASEYSEGPNAQRGGEVGVVAPGDLFDPNLDRAVFNLSVAEVSDPVVSSRGVHLLRLDSVTDDGRRAISQVFLPIEVAQEDVDAARSEIDNARSRILNGESFGLVASEVSGDPASASKGGVLGTFRLEDLSAQFQAALAEAEVGEVTEPVMTSAGWYIFQINDRIAGHMYTYEELKDNLRQVVEGQKIEEALAKYVLDLREQFFIDEKS
ncbi:MAG: peptidylprolyl isomerase [Candidatus Krumholzibacteriota bacterium]